MSRVALFESSKDGGVCLQEVLAPDFRPDIGGQEMRLLQVYTNVEEQTIKGFGGAFTQSSAEVFYQMGKPEQEEILELLFGSENLAYNCGRIPMGACDFSSGNFSYCDELDPSLESFSLGRDADTVLPFVQAAAVKVPELELLTSPWSPPAWMKTNSDMCHGGELKEECYGIWADYFVRFLKAYAEAGVQIGMVTIQNEPKAVQTWESCVYSSEQEKRFIEKFLAPALQKAGLTDIGIVIWDHNKERAFIRAQDIMDCDNMRKLVHGIAFHWYSGDHFENIALCRRFFPEQELIFTEGCVELRAKNTVMAAKAESAGRDNAVENAPWEFGEFYAHDIMGNLNAGMNRFIDWNLLLDIQGGPNHVGNYCSAPLICNIKDGKIYKQPSFYYIAHFSRFLQKGSVRLAVSRYTPELEALAAKTPSGDIIVIMMNTTAHPLELTINDVCAARIADYTLKPHSIASMVWHT